MTEVGRADIENIRKVLFKIVEAITKQDNTLHIVNKTLEEIRDALKKEDDGDRAVVLGDS